MCRAPSTSLGRHRFTNPHPVFGLSVQVRASDLVTWVWGIVARLPSSVHLLYTRLHVGFWGFCLGTSSPGPPSASRRTGPMSPFTCTVMGWTRALRAYRNRTLGTSYRCTLHSGDTGGHAQQLPTGGGMCARGAAACIMAGPSLVAPCRTQRCVSGVRLGTGVECALHLMRRMPRLHGWGAALGARGAARAMPPSHGQQAGGAAGHAFAAPVFAARHQNKYYPTVNKGSYYAKNTNYKQHKSKHMNSCVVHKSIEAICARHDLPARPTPLGCRRLGPGGPAIARPVTG